MKTSRSADVPTVIASRLPSGENRGQMNASASLAERLVRKSAGRYLLRPEPHRFADFRVLRHAEVPAVLFEAGYISNPEDQELLASDEGQQAFATATAQAIRVYFARLSSAFPSR